MKKTLSTSILVLLAVLSLLGLTSCSSASDEQKTKMDNLMAQYESLIKDCENSVNAYPSIPEDIEYTDKLNQLKATMQDIITQSIEIRKTYNENKDIYSPEEADKLINSLEEHLKACENFSKQLKDGLNEIASLQSETSSSESIDNPPVSKPSV